MAELKQELAHIQGRLADLKKDREVLLAACKGYGYTLNTAPMPLRADRELQARKLCAFFISCCTIASGVRFTQPLARIEVVSSSFAPSSSMRRGY